MKCEKLSARRTDLIINSKERFRSKPLSSVFVMSFIPFRAPKFFFAHTFTHKKRKQRKNRRCVGAGAWYGDGDEQRGIP